MNDTHVYSVAEFEQVIDIYTLVQNDDSDYIENIEDEELQEFMRDISPNSPVDGCCRDRARGFARALRLAHAAKARARCAKSCCRERVSAPTKHKDGEKADRDPSPASC